MSEINKAGNSYHAAQDQADEQRTAYVAWAGKTNTEIADELTAQAHADGVLPANMRIEWNSEPVLPR